MKQYALKKVYIFKSFLKFRAVQGGIFYNLKGFAAEIRLNFSFKSNKAMLVKNTPNDAAE